jgi:sigma-B regulation protein RsbU (phosphoserine phosphatase)
MAKGLPEATELLTLPDRSKMLLSYSRSPGTQLAVFSAIDRKAALKAVDLLLAKSILFFVALISLTIIISVIASKRLTSALTLLHQATKKIGEGKFDEVNIQVNSKDEIGDLANRFNQMASEVSNLMKANMERVRMEDELKTAKLVQETLFPAPKADLGKVEIAGRYEPASECGGDWWHYCKIGGKDFFWIGDATGHGVPAALITSAARSTACMIELYNDQNLGPAQAMSYMNRTILQTSSGKMNMTFFIGCYDPKTNKFSYASAGHLPPYLISQGSQLKPLQDSPGSPLGYDPNTEYTAAEFEVTPGTSIICFTDGLQDVVNPAGEAFGKKRVRNLFKEAGDKTTRAEAMVEDIYGQLMSYRSNTQLVDDVTFFAIHFKA